LFPKLTAAAESDAYVLCNINQYAKYN
jgi:hypothetical protein